MNDVVSRDGQALLGKQVRKDRCDVLPTLQLGVGVENDCLDQRLGLLATRFPNGFDGQAHFCQWWRDW